MPLSNSIKKEKDPERIAVMRQEVLKAIKESEEKEEMQKAKDLKKNKAKQKIEVAAKPAPAKEPKKREDEKIKPAVSVSQPIGKKTKMKVAPPKKAKQAANKQSLKEKFQKEAVKKIANYKNNLNKLRAAPVINRFKLKSTHNKIFLKNKKRTSSLIFAGLIFILLLFVVAGFYFPKSESRLARKVSQIIPFPAIIIEGKFISYSQYLQELDAVKTFLAKQKERGIIRELPSHNQVREDVKIFLIKREIINSLAEQHQITISEQEIENEVDQIRKQARSDESVEKVLKDLYGWSLRDFEIKVVRPYLINFKLSKELFPDLSDGQELKQALGKKLEEIENELKIYVLVD